MDSAKSRDRRGPWTRAVLTATAVSRSASYLIVAVATLVLTAWATDMQAADALIPGLSRMNPMTAAALGLAGVALTLPRSTRPSPTRVLKQALGGAVAIIGAAMLLAGKLSQSSRLASGGGMILLWTGPVAAILGGINGYILWSQSAFNLGF